MTHEDIDRLIDAMNNGTMQGRAFTRPLTPNVDFAKTWIGLPGMECSGASHDFYFIKAGSQKYIAAVLDMGTDLHVYVKESQRKKGYLTGAMKDVILPTLLRNGRSKQRVTFEEPAIGEYCVRNWGFKITGKSTAELDLSSLVMSASYAPIAPSMHESDLAEMKLKIRCARLHLEMLKDHIEMKFGQNEFEILSDQIDDQISDLGYLADRIECFISKNNPPAHLR